jgi:hypothetical protein
MLKQPEIKITKREQQQLRAWAREDRTTPETVLRHLISAERMRRTMIIRAPISRVPDFS